MDGDWDQLCDGARPVMDKITRGIIAGAGIVLALVVLHKIMGW